ncbi:cytochrome P450 [Dothidotthia symphoricarpi CBS 119687]|uniref:Cytochrome P450 n=1 Tax=Dothidotthia symphoricarpi CBS 119687 TaxID=1392245 RepID=A0A6A5ZWA8_9PLEO|nr:cytochrome P450 [Dothidotthia symphoricarpi CBS 119687]KAF2124032.1 cytochrome P450 [Dothidotthia symphoricarpi CBS 119687]
MAVPKRALLLASAAISFFAFRYAPQAVISSSIVWNVVILFFGLWTGQFAWQTVVTPLFFSPLRNLPQPPNAHFFLGHYRSIYKGASGEPQRDWIDNVPNDGVLYYRWLFNKPRILVTNPKALSEVLVQKSYEFVKPARIRVGLGKLLGVGVLLAEGDEHKRQRKLLAPAFAFRHTKNLYPIFWNKTMEMTDRISATINSSPDASSVVEIRNWSSRATLDIIGLAGMGRDFDSLTNPDNELYTTYNNIFGANRASQVLQLVLGLLPHWLASSLPIKRNDVIRQAIITIKKTARDLIREKRAKQEKGEAQSLDILSVAMESGGFSDEDLVNQLMTFLAAGHETTASSMAWAVYLLCKHPDVQKRLREEVRAEIPALTDPSKEISSTEIDRLTYLNAVLNETMRIFPPVPLTLRVAAHDTTILGHFIPEETTVVICPWAINTSVHLWGDDAREFNPERWMGPGRANTGGAESNFAITTFLHGPRSCIGKDFAKAEFACLVAGLVGRFEMELEDPGWELKIQGGITARPKGGLRVKMTEVVQ